MAIEDNVQVQESEGVVVVFGLHFPLDILDAEVEGINDFEKGQIGAGYSLNYCPPLTDEFRDAEIRIFVRSPVVDIHVDSTNHSAVLFHFETVVSG
jgi:hypothetical protein